MLGDFCLCEEKAFYFMVNPNDIIYNSTKRHWLPTEDILRIFLFTTTHCMYDTIPEDDDSGQDKQFLLGHLL